MMKRMPSFFLLICLLLTGCARTANVNPLVSPGAVSTAAGTSTLAVTLAPSASSTPTAVSSATPQPIGTLDVSFLPTQLPASVKGYELYSWQVGTDWNFTLITGTNRTKALDEITAPGNSVSSDGFVKISVNGLDDLKLVLGRLPRGSSILWGGIDLGGEIPAGMVYLTFPPQMLIDEVTTYCTGKGLTLTSLKPQ